METWFKRRVQQVVDHFTKRWVDRVNVFPDEIDRVFSDELWRLMKKEARRLGILNFAIEIAEKYSNEVSPHYHFCRATRAFDPRFTKISSHDVEQSVEYDATTIGNSRRQTYHGKVIIRVFSESRTALNGHLAAILEKHYRDAIERYYPEWDTTYIDSTLHTNAIIPLDSHTDQVALPDPLGGTITASDWAA